MVSTTTPPLLVTLHITSLLNFNRLRSSLVEIDDFCVELIIDYVHGVSTFIICGDQATVGCRSTAFVHVCAHAPYILAWSVFSQNKVVGAKSVYEEKEIKKGTYFYCSEVSLLG